MPRHTGTVPKYRKRTNGGITYAVVELGGQLHYLGHWGSAASRAEYDRLVAEWLAAGRPSTAIDKRGPLSVVELIAHYWNYAEGYYGSTSQQADHVRRILRLVRQHYGDTPAAEFGPRRLKAIRQMLIQRGNARSYINSNIDRIKRMFKWAVGEELIAPATYHALHAVAGLRKGRSAAKETQPVGPVADDVIDQTLPHLPDVVADMIRLQRLTGARPSEVCNMRPMDIARSDEVWIYTPSSHKTEHHGKRRYVAIGPRAQAVLAPYLLRPAGDYCFSPAQSERKRNARRRESRNTPMTPSHRARSAQSGKRKFADRYNTDSYRRAIHRACDKAGLERWSPNQLRHAAGTEVRRRFGLEATQCVLGHSRADVTQVYAQRDLAKAAEVAKAIG